jgi:hypothetical protein
MTGPTEPTDGQPGDEQPTDEAPGDEQPGDEQPADEGAEPAVSSSGWRRWRLPIAAALAFLLLGGAVYAFGSTDDGSDEASLNIRDRDHDGIADEDDPDGGTMTDADRDGVADEEDVDDGTVADRDNDGVADADDPEPDDASEPGTTGSSPGTSAPTGSSVPSIPLTTTSTTPITVPGWTGTIPPGIEVDPEIMNAYVVAFYARCDQIFSLSPTGEMYDPEEPDDVYTTADCRREIVPYWAGDYSTIGAAEAAAREDATNAAGYLTVYNIMCWSDDGCWNWENES